MLRDIGQRLLHHSVQRNGPAGIYVSGLPCKPYAPPGKAEACSRSRHFDDFEGKHRSENEPQFGKQAAYLDSIDPTAIPPIPRLPVERLKQLKRQGVKIIAPPIFALLAVNGENEIVPSQYAKDIKELGFHIISWTFERSDLREGASKAGFYWMFDPEGKAVKKDSDM